MPSIDISRYNTPKKNKPADKKEEHSILAILNKDINFGSKELPDKKKEHLYIELNSLLHAGINLKSSLELIANDQEKENGRTLFKAILADVINGSAFSESLEKTGKFSLYEVYSLQIGEETGKLTEVLEDLAKFYHNKIKQRRKIVSSLTYPCVVMSTSLGAVFFMLKFVVPMFGDVFKRFGGRLPWLTEKVIGIAAAMQTKFPIFFAIAVLITTGLLMSRNTELYRKTTARIVLRIPIVGSIVQKVYLARFCNSMRLLINARLPLLRAIALSRQMIGFYPIQTSLATVERNIMQGETLHQSLQKFKIYPLKMIQLIKVGEETNQLDYFFSKISDQYIEEIEYKTSTLSSSMEPLIIIFLGVIVGIILISMYLPLFEMSNSFQ